MATLHNQWINYHHLYYFYVIALKGSMAEASSFLRIGSPTLSTQLKHLEDRFECQLFDRRSKQLFLTEQGKVVYEYANEIFKLGAELNEVMHEKRVAGKKHLRLGALDCIPKSLVATVIQAAQSESPCSVNVSEGDMESLLRELHQHRIDLIITNHSSYLGFENETFTKSILKSKIGVFGASKFKSYSKNFPNSLQGAPLVLPSTASRLRVELDQYFRLNQIQPDIVAETQDMSVQKLLGVRGYGLVTLPIPTVKAMNFSKELFLIGTLDEVYEEYFLISGDRKIRNPIAVQLFKHFKLNPK